MNYTLYAVVRITVTSDAYEDVIGVIEEFGEEADYNFDSTDNVKVVDTEWIDTSAIHPGRVSGTSTARPALPLCPDHRDKVRDLSCRQCTVESLKKSVDLAIDTLDPDMSRSELVQLRETLLRRRNEIGE